MTVGLFLAGVQKCGTTSLFHYLAGHPQLQAPRRKEIHFFDDETVDWRRRDFGALHACFDGGGEGRLRFDATPIYLFWPSALERIKAYNPRARLILLFRDPIERAYSHWRMERLRGAEDLPFSEAIRDGRARLPGGDLIHGNWRDRSYVERGFYGAQLARALSLFPKAQVLVLASEDLRQRHAATLDRVAGFLGIAPFPPVAARLENQAPPSPLLPPVGRDDHAHLRALYAEDMRRFAALSGVDVGVWRVMRPFSG